VLNNLGYTGNAAPGASVTTASAVSPGGIQGTGATGATGPAGTTGATGPTGTAGPDFLSGSSSGTSLGASATTFVGTSGASTTEANVQFIQPVTQTYTKFYCFGPKPTGGTSDVFTVRVGGASQTGTCTIASGGTTVVTATVSITISAGSLVDVQVANGNSAGAATWALAP
jgi:hypothetical protein